MTALCRSWTFTLTVSLLVLLLGLPLGHRAFAQDDTVVVDRVASGNSSGIVKLGSEGQGKSPRDLSADDWPYNRGMFRHMEPNSSGWPRLPSEAEIKAAADANILAKKQGFTYPGFVNASGGCGFYAPDWAGTYAIHRPGDPSSNAVYLFVSAVLRQTDDCDSSKLDQRGYKTFAWGSARNLWLTRLQYRDGWRFIDMYDDGGLMITAGNVDKNGVQKLMGQFRDDMASRGFVEGLSEGGSAPGDSGESPGSTAAGPATSLPGAIWSAPPAGFSGIGDVPGPRTLGEAAAGVAIPAVVIILVNTLAGLPGGGGAPSPVSVPPPAGPPPIDEEAERRARQLKQDEDDLRRVREMKSFLGATAAGAGQAGFNTADHERKLADLTRQERELTAAIARAGGDSSYTAAERATNAVGAGFVEANRIAQEFDRQQAIAAARAKMEQLERDRLKAEQDYYKNVREGFWQNTVKDVDAIPGQLREAAKSGLRTIGQVVHDTGNALTDRTNWEAAARAAIATVHDIIAHPVDSTAKVAEVYGAAAKGAARAARHIANNPAETIKSVLGVDNWEKAFDPNVPVTERIARVLGGIADIASTLVGVKQGATAAKAALTAAEHAAPGMASGALKAGRVGASAKEFNRFGIDLADIRKRQRDADKGVGRYAVVDDPSVPVRRKGDTRIDPVTGKQFVAQSGLLDGMSVQAQKHAQIVADRHGVKVDIRPTNKDALERIANGTAVPKAGHCKVKTINDIDTLLGADKKNVGLAGYFEPRMPRNTSSLSADELAAVKKRYQERLQEYHDQAEHLVETRRSGKTYVRDGVVYDGPTGKPYTGDHDIMEIRDATTGKPLPRYEVNHLGEIILNKDGSPKLNPVRERIIKELQQPPFNAQHGAHLDWKYDHLSRDAPTTSPIKGLAPKAVDTAPKSEFDLAQGIDKGVMAKHGRVGEPVISITGGQSEPGAAYVTGAK